MKNIFKFLVLTVSLSVALSMKDYCKMQWRVCGDKHIGCEENEYEKWAGSDSLKLGTVTTSMKEIILDKINSFRRLVASGKHEQFESASNMRLVTWNDEMEYLATKLVSKLPSGGPGCVATDANPRSVQIYYEESEKSAPTDFITSTFDYIINSVIKFRTASDPDFSSFYSANLTNIGCAFGTYRDGGKTMGLKCVQNERDEYFFSNPYQQGKPCSNCSPDTQVCSERYPGLCENVKVLPVGQKGEPGRPGLDGEIGLPGVKGDRGEDGLAAPPGARGLSGDTGSKGDRGLIGPAGKVGPRGPVGPAGLQGLPGVSGTIGVQGPTGDASLPVVKEVRGLDGFVGAPGIQGENAENSNDISEDSAFFWYLLGSLNGMKSNK